MRCNHQEEEISVRRAFNEVRVFGSGTSVKYLIFIVLFLALQLVFLPGYAAADLIRNGASSYSSMQTAVNAASTGNTIESQAVTFHERLILNKDIDITLRGGYDTGFSSNNNNLTTIQGPVIIRFGSVIIDQIAVSGANFPPNDDSSRNYIGLNVWFLNDWDESFAFVDAIKHARPWRNTSWSADLTGDAIDSLGWPTQDASTVIFTGTAAQVNGTYKLVFNGQANVSLMWYSGSVTNKSYDSATNTTTADVTINISSSGSGGLVFTNTKRTAGSSTNTGFTNARLYRPGYPADGSAVFTTPFLTALGKTSVVRMMDWTATNLNLTQHWSDRRTPLHMYKAGASYTGPGGAHWDSANTSTGVALEHQIQLCNTLFVDCWINIPVVADDDYITNIAYALKYGTDGTNPYTEPQANPVYPPLDPNLKIYIEYANEIWNSGGGFDCLYAIHDITGTLPAGHDVNIPAETNEWYLVWRYPAWRTAGISDIFRSVYGDAAMMTRVRPVLMTQQGNGQATISVALTWFDAYAHRQVASREVSSYIYGAGGSGYYGVNSEPANHADLDGFFAPGNYPATVNVRGIGVDAIWAANFGLKRIAYEGGPSLDPYTDAEATAINADSRMQDMVVKTHDAWSSMGGDLLMYYTLVGPSKWEFTPDITTTNTPKFLAIDQLQLQQRAPVTIGQALPGSLIAVTYWEGTSSLLRINTGSDYVHSYDGLSCIGGNDAGEWIALPGHASSAFTGSLVVNGATSSATTIAVWINGERKGEVTLAASGGHLVNSTSLSVSIPSGLVVIRLEVLSEGFALYSIAVN
jgi:hypothetical protein